MTNRHLDTRPFVWLRSNWVLVVAALTIYEIVILVVRAQRAAHGAARGVGLLLNADNLFAAATFIAVAYFPFLVMGLFAWFVPRLLLASDALSTSQRLTYLMVLAAALVLMTLSSPAYYLLLLVFGILAQLALILTAEELFHSRDRPLHRLRVNAVWTQRRQGRARRAFPVWIPVGLVTLLPTAVIVQSSALWIPVEALTLANGLKVAPVYVVQVTEIWTTTMYVESGEFRVLPTPNVAYREFCAINSTPVSVDLRAILGLSAYPIERPC